MTTKYETNALTLENLVQLDKRFESFEQRESQRQQDWEMEHRFDEDKDELPSNYCQVEDARKMMEDRRIFKESFVWVQRTNPKSPISVELCRLMREIKELKREKAPKLMIDERVKAARWIANGINRNLVEEDRHFDPEVEDAQGGWMRVKLTSGHQVLPLETKLRNAIEKGASGKWLYAQMEKIKTVAVTRIMKYEGVQAKEALNLKVRFENDTAEQLKWWFIVLASRVWAHYKTVKFLRSK